MLCVFLPAHLPCRSLPNCHFVIPAITIRLIVEITFPFVNNSNGQRGLVCQYDVVCFDEVSGISFDQKDGINIMKGYMESGEFSRGRESIRASGSMVMVGNFE
jgi:predicted ATP-dependent Lon-type protease